MCNAYGEPYGCGGHKDCGGESGSGIYASGSPVSSYYNLKPVLPSGAVLRVAEIQSSGHVNYPGALARPLTRFSSGNVSYRTNWKFAALSVGKLCSGSLC